MGEVTARLIGAAEDLRFVVDRLKKAFKGKVWASALLRNERDFGFRVYVNIVVDEKEREEGMEK